MSKNENQLIEAVAYCRFSSHNQREESITAQMRAINKFAEGSYIIKKFYIDEAQSGKDAERIQFQNMIHDLKENQEYKNVKALVVHKFDRFSRNRRDSAIYKSELRKLGILVISTLEPIDNSPESVLLESLYEGMSEYYIKNLSREVLKGLKENVYQGLSTGSCPIGLKVNPITKKFEIDEETAPIVRLIFNEFVYKRSTYVQIADKLKWMGCKTNKGNDFSKTSFIDILQNEKYVGKMTYFKTRRDPITGERIRNRRGDTTGMLIVDNVIPPIIDKKTFEKAQEILATRRKYGRTLSNTKNNNILIGLVYCGECGAPMNVNTRKSKEGYYYGTYRCNNKKKKGTNCINSEISMEHLKRYVILNLMDFLQNPDTVSKIILGIQKAYRDELCSTRNDEERIKKEINSIKNKQKSLVEKLSTAPTNVIKLLYEEIEQLAFRQEELEHILKNITSTDEPDFPITQKEVTLELEKVQEYLLSENDELIKEVLQSFIQRINVYKDKVEIIYDLNLFYSSNHREIFKYVITRKSLKKNKGILPQFVGGEEQKNTVFNPSEKDLSIHKALALVKMKNVISKQFKWF